MLDVSGPHRISIVDSDNIELELTLVRCKRKTLWCDGLSETIVGDNKTIRPHQLNSLFPITRPLDRLC